MMINNFKELFSKCCYSTKIQTFSTDVQISCECEQTIWFINEYYKDHLSKSLSSINIFYSNDSGKFLYMMKYKDVNTNEVVIEYKNNHEYNYEYISIYFRNLQTYFVCCNGDFKSSKLMIIRFIRQIYKYEAIKDGWIYFHASCLENNGRGLLFTGDKYTGKTTSLINYIFNDRNTKFISNDKVFLKLVDNEIQVKSVPYRVSIRNTTLDHFKNLNDIFASESLFYDEIPSKIRLLPSEFIKCMGVESLVGTKLNYIIIPIYCKNLNSVILKNVELNNSIKTIKDNLLNIDDLIDSITNEIYNIKKEEYEITINRFLLSVSSYIQFYKLKQNESLNKESYIVLKNLLKKEV